MQVVQDANKHKQPKGREKSAVREQGIKQNQGTETEPREHRRTANQRDRPLVALASTWVIDQADPDGRTSQCLDDGHCDEEDNEVLERRIRHLGNREAKLIVWGAAAASKQCIPNLCRFGVKEAWGD